MVIYSQYPPEIVEDALKEQLGKLGNKGKENKGFLARSGFLEFKNASVPEYNISGVDLVFKVERRSRKESDESVVYLVVGKSADNFATSDTDPELIESAKSFLSAQLPHIEAHNLEVEIGKQDEVVKKAEKKLTNLQDDQRDLDKKIKDLQSKLEQNKKDIEKQNGELEKQRLSLEGMKGKRKTPANP